MKPNDTKKNQKPKNLEVWGLTGGIASGKSSVAKIFSQSGIAVLDADQLTRDLSKEGGAAHSEIQAAFGTTDRKKLREIIFSDPKAKKILEGIFAPAHPTRKLEQNAKGGRSLKELKTCPFNL